MSWELIVQIFTVFSSLFVLGATIAAYLAVGATRKAADAQIAKSFLDQYSSEEWAQSLQTLQEYSKAFSDGVVPMTERLELSTRHGPTVPDGSKQDNARRMVHWFYRNAWQLYDKKLLSKKAMELIVETNGYELFHDVAVPMSYNRDNWFDMGKRWSWYRELVQKFPPQGSRQILNRTLDAMLTSAEEDK